MLAGLRFILRCSCSSPAWSSSAPAPPSHRKPNNRTTEQPNRPSPPSPSRVEPAYSGRKRPPMHPTRLRCCCSTCSQFCALYLTCAAAAAPHQRGPLRLLRAALAAAASFAHAWRRASPSHVLCTALPCTGRPHDLIAISHTAPSACTCTSRVNTRAELTHHTPPSSATPVHNQHRTAPPARRLRRMARNRPTSPLSQPASNHLRCRPTSPLTGESLTLKPTRSKVETTRRPHLARTA